MITGAAWRSCLAAVITLSTGARALSSSGQQKHLAVIVPAYRGDLQRAVSSLKRWPTVCSPLTQANVDLVLYYAEGEEDAQEVDEAEETIFESAGRCFARTRTVYASLEEQDDFYPKGPSVQFYKMFLDDDVRAQLAEYDALAIMEWDMLVAANNSFEELYKVAFADGGEFWVKGSNLGGTNFHVTAKKQEMWHVLGHINGNAIYNNNDPAFVEYVAYTRARWQYEYPYDVALWLTISDFPYSWPLWQRYSSKFVTTNLISSVGGEHVDSSSVSDAVAGHTLFIHGHRVDDGNIASRKAVMEETNKRRPYSAVDRKRKRDRKLGQRLRAPVPEEAIEPACTSACGSEETASSLPDGTSTVCDASCGNGNGNPLIDDFLCDAGDADKYGSKCRICFKDEEEARRLQRVLVENLNESQKPRVIMCHTMKPPEPECSSECLSKSYTVCDDSCGTGRYGDFDCNWKDGGHKCRFCFNDIEAALAADKIAKLQGGRVIMCSTMEPPAEADESDVEIQALPIKIPELPGDDSRSNQRFALDASEAAEAGDEAPSNPNTSRRLQNWRETERWKTEEKWRANEKYKVAENWKFDGLRFPEAPGQEVCFDECPRLYSNGVTGRICDDTCATREYGFVGCQTKGGIFGTNCRLCYVDPELALEVDDMENNERAIMCDTGLPVTAYDQNPTRRLTAKEPKSALSIGQSLQDTKRKSDAASTSIVVNDPENGSYGNTDLPGDDVNRIFALKPSEADKAGDEAPSNPNILRNLQNWKENEKWKTEEKWRANEKYKELEKWKFDGVQFPEVTGQEACLDECSRLYSNGVTGRICDDTCATGEYGSAGCQTKDGIFGTNCRLCYVDPELALEVDDMENNERAIMCDTGLPVTAYDQNPTRRLSADDLKSALSIGRRLQDTKRQPDEASASVMANDPENGSYGNSKIAATEIANLFAELSHQPFTEHITRGEICAFIASRDDEVEKWEVTVRSILQFELGMRIVIAVEGDPQVYRRAVGDFPGVIVRRTPNAFLASLNADKHCGPGTRLIFYIEADSVLSRTFTAKDTHSPDGKLLVVYSEPRTRAAVKLSTLSSSILGFRPPSFTQGADLILPVEANAALRDMVLSKLDAEGAVPGMTAILLGSMGEFSEIAAVPQILAALEYSRKASGVWFFNPEAWVAEHLFKPASIWDIPLVKPRFACALPANARLPNPTKVLEENLDFFSRGGKCESGLIAVDVSR